MLYFPFILFFPLVALYAEPYCFDKPMYFVTATDTEHYPWVIHLINSIKKYHAQKEIVIAVFDLGLTESERELLNNLDDVTVYDVEKANPHIFTKFKVRRNGRLARGWYSWKPVVLYQALQLFPYMLYLDAGIEVIGPLDSIFKYIEKNGYYLFEGPLKIETMITNHVKRLFELNERDSYILQKKTISAGIQGLSRDMLDAYVIPLYELAHSIKNFEDEGTAPGGFGNARHDQTICSIIARQLKLKCTSLSLGLSNYFYLRKHKEHDPVLIEHARKNHLK